MSTPSFDKGQGEPTSGAPADPFAAPGQPSSGQPAPDPYGPPAGYGSPPQGGGYGVPPPAGYGATPQGYGAPAGYGAPPQGYGAPGGYGAAPGYGGSPSGVVGPGGEWLGPPLASWGLRAGGYVIDTVIAVVVSQVLAQVSTALGQVANLALLLVFGYLTGTKGQTPGRQLVGTKVVAISDGQVIGAGAGIGRQFAHILDALPLLLGFLWPIWDKKNQTFADKIVKSVVLKV
ncbi:MAG: hypothetical protein JWN17_2931 [Frankiales bacterium]|nr:hypothetical protein [Frankiales bacterium]